jgi:hydroxyacylglutathione hydrolase
MAIPLEDKFADIIGKAQRGLKLADSALASKSGVEVETLERLRAGDFDAAAAGRVAVALGLNPAALIAAGEKAWQPKELNLQEFNGLAQFNTPFDDMTVNSYLVWDEETKKAVAFDTGADCSDTIEGLRQHGLTLDFILLTHTHGDHIFDLDRLKSVTGAPAFASSREALEGAEPFEEGRKFEAGNLKIETRLTWGHSRGGITYIVHGLTRLVAIVGDSLFAGSMGGGMISYEEALKNNREKILTLPDETILCPGHGPMTTVGEEKVHNPFFAE